MGRLAATNFGNGSTETKTYDTMAGDLLDIWTIGTGASTLTRQSYTYDGLGRKAIETLASGATRGFSYDGAGQLTSEVKSGSSGYTANYTYDNAGNRLTKSQGGATDTYTYDNANKLISVAGGSVSKAYAYDNAGNVVAVTSGTDTTNLTWDGDGRLAGINYPNASSNTFAYNGLGQRVGKLDSGGTFGYTLADDAIDSNVLADGQASYQYGAGLVSEVRGGTSKVYHADSLGTTRAMSGASGTATDTLETDAFGNTVSATGSTLSPFGFAGQHGYQTDVDSGLMKLGYRYYDASVGRFISRDPIQDGYNWYAYCENDPVNGVDPDGLKIIPPTNPADRQAFYVAQWYLMQNPEYRDMLRDLSNSNVDYTIVINHGDDDHYDPNDQTIHWDPNSALITTDGGRQTPALGIGHELDHAWADDQGLYPSGPASDPDYDDEEEKRAITGRETNAALQLGESPRTNHDGTPIQVHGPLNRWH